MSERGHNPDGSTCPGHLLGSTQLIEDLRPKTPPRDREASSGSGLNGEGTSPRGSWGRGRGGGRGLSIVAPKPMMMAEGYGSPLGSPYSPATVSPLGTPHSPAAFYASQDFYAEGEMNMCSQWPNTTNYLQYCDGHFIEQQMSPRDLNAMGRATGPFLSYRETPNSHMWHAAAPPNLTAPPNMFQTSPRPVARGRGRSYYQGRGSGQSDGGWWM